MSTQILPAASLRSARCLPAARTLFRVPNYLSYMALWSIGRAIFGVAWNFLPALSEGALPGGVEQGADHRRAVDLARIGVDPAVVHRALGDMVELLEFDPDIAQPGRQPEARDQLGHHLGCRFVGAPQRLADPRLLAGVDRVVEAQHVRHPGGAAQHMADPVARPLADAGLRADHRHPGADLAVEPRLEVGRVGLDR